MCIKKYKEIIFFIQEKTNNILIKIFRLLPLSFQVNISCYHIHIYLQTYIHIYTCMHIHIHTQTNTHTRLHITTHKNTHIQIYKFACNLLQSVSRYPTTRSRIRWQTVRCSHGNRQRQSAVLS